MERINLSGADWWMKEFVGMDWVWRDSVKPGTGDVRWWYPATVPGCVLHDLCRNGRVPDPFFELNSKLVEWVPARTWVYRKEFEVGENLAGKRVELCFDGVDYECEVFLNGESLGHHEGMFVPFRIDISGRLRAGEKNLLAVVLEPAPQEQPQVGRTSLVHTHKSRMTYWWDFCPRMIHQGIWQDVYLEVSGPAVLRDFYLYSEFTAEKTVLVHLEAETEGISEGCLRGWFGELPFCAELVDGGCETVIAVREPRLWWTNGEGEPYEYEVRLELYERRDGKERLSDCRTRKFGLRRIVFEQNEGALDPAGCFTLCLNGKKLYMKGCNWVPADVMYGAVTEERLRHLVRLAKEAGVNIFRIWGGGLIETDLFYRICAENGILIWQEFIQSSSGIENQTPKTEEYCSLMCREAERIIKAKRNHTALAIWCGGNELQDEDGMPLDDSDRLLGMLSRQVKRWDKGRKWLPTSPSGGLFLNSLENIKKAPDRLLDVHGPWEHQGLLGHCRLYNAGTSLLSSEFGVEGMANRYTLERCVAPEHLLPADKDNEIYFHRGAWWDNEPLVQKTFGGELDEIGKIQRASQFLQYEGLKYALECNLRRAMHSSGSFPWQFNEPYPNLFCTSVVDYYGFPKPAYYGIKKAYGAYLVSASFDSPSLAGRSELRAEIYAGGKAPQEEGLRVRTELFDLDGNLVDGVSWELDATYLGDENVHRRVGVYSCSLSEIPTPICLLRVRAELPGKVIAENEYLFTKGEDFGEIYRQKEAGVTVRAAGDILEVTNTGDRAALFVCLTQEDDGGEGFLYLEDNYFSLMKGESRSIRATGRCSRMAVHALNISHQIVEGPAEGDRICRS